MRRSASLGLAFYIETKDVLDEDLLNDIYLSDIQTIDDVEHELGKYIQDFSLMEVAWKVANPFP